MVARVLGAAGVCWWEVVVLWGVAQCRLMVEFASAK